MVVVAAAFVVDVTLAVNIKVCVAEVDVVDLVRGVVVISLLVTAAAKSIPKPEDQIEKFLPEEMFYSRASARHTCFLAIPP